MRGRSDASGHRVRKRHRKIVQEQVRILVPVADRESSLVRSGVVRLDLARTRGRRLRARNRAVGSCSSAALSPTPGVRPQRATTWDQRVASNGRMTQDVMERGAALDSRAERRSIARTGIQLCAAPITRSFRIEISRESTYASTRESSILAVSDDVPTKDS